ncbi:MAG TPA: hypothetical protein DIU47_01230 [Candidatus Pacebacteria bacterium]|nr:hypothetical protein [Candidatus Paceibacterota bacterium]
MKTTLYTLQRRGIKRMKHLQKILCAIVLALFFGFFSFATPSFSSFSSIAHAQTLPEISLSISPPHAEILLQPGKSIVQAFNIKNTGSADLEVTPFLADFTVDSTGTPTVHIEKPSSFLFATLQNLDKTLGVPFVLSAGKSDQLVLRIHIPETSQERDYYQTLVLQAKPSSLTMLTQTTNSQSLANVGVHMLISISKTGADLGELTIEKLIKPFILDSFMPLRLQIFAKNTGKTYTKAQGEVTIRSLITNRIVTVFPILRENVLAGGVRELHAAIKDPDDEKSSIADVFIYHPLFLFGPYEIRIDVHAENQQSSPVVFHVWALPFTLFAVGGMGYAILLWKRKRERKFEENL